MDLVNQIMVIVFIEIFLSFAGDFVQDGSPAVSWDKWK